MKNFTFKLCLVAMTMLMTSAFQQRAMAQDFLGIFEKITDKNFDAFMENWIAWSSKEAMLAKREVMNELTNQVVADISDGSGYVERYNANSKYTVLQCDLSITKHSGELGKRKPQTDEYKEDETESVSIRPFAETGKPILYLNNEMAMLLIQYIQSDRSGKRLEKLKEYFNVVPDGGGYHFCSVPYVAAFDVFADCVVVNCREGWGNGSWVKYVPQFKYKKAETISEWMR